MIIRIIQSTFFFILIHSAVFAFDCIYSAKPNETNPYSDLYPQGECGEIIGDDILKLKNSHFGKLTFNEEGLATIIVSSKPDPLKVFYVSQDRKVVRAHFFDNNADYFQEGLARTISNNKFGFINKNLETVITPEYDFAFPFVNSHAIVCNHCKPEIEGEHKKIVGGTWGVINKAGKVAIPLIYPQKELYEQEEFIKLFGKPVSIYE
ncbi:MAG: WG repeat-containing protein [Desulfobulbaceae bacterium]|jgi:hypothetical protein